MAKPKMEEVVRPDGALRSEVITFRCRWESVAAIDAFAEANGIAKRSDAMRLLLRDGLKANGY